MKIITNNLPASKPVYPYNYTCQYCRSVLQIETAADIKNNIVVKEPITDPKNYQPDRTVLALGFNCPVCHKDNITG